MQRRVIQRAAARSPTVRRGGGAHFSLVLELPAEGGRQHEHESRQDHDAEGDLPKVRHLCQLSRVGTTPDRVVYGGDPRQTLWRDSMGRWYQYGSCHTANP